jgi:hypothetical protein
MSTLPSLLTAGDSWRWSETVPGHEAAAGWSCAYRLIGPGVADRRILFGAAADGGAVYVWDVPADITSGLTPGTYAWARLAIHADGLRVTLATGHLTITPDPAAATVEQMQSHARRMLAAIDAALAARASEGELDLIATAAGGRSAQYDPALLMTMRRQFAAAVAAEDAAAARARGERPGMVQVRFA